MRVVKKYTNANWRQEKEDTIIVAVATGGKVVHIYAHGRFGDGYIWMAKWAWDMEEVTNNFPQLWLAELRGQGVQI